MNKFIQKKLPSEITSYDLLKTFAVIIMVVDHLGHYFFPEQEWWRAIGRLCVPIWFFLIGYSKSRDIPPKLILGALLLTIVDFIVGMPIFPLNVLVSMAIIRVSIDYIMEQCKKSPSHLWEVGVLLFILVLPTGFVAEYGTQGMLIAIYGYLVRKKEEFGHKTVFAFMLFSLSIFIIYQQIGGLYSFIPMLFMIVGTLIVCMYLLNFSYKLYPAVKQKMPSYLTAIIQFCGRYTLEIYVVHLVLFKFMALFLGMENFALFDFKILSS